MGMQSRYLTNTAGSTENSFLRSVGFKTEMWLQGVPALTILKY
jgi:hypothetical protein